MPYEARVFVSIRDVPAEDWSRIQAAQGDAFTDPRFLEIAEETLGSLTRAAPVVIYDDERRAVAFTILSTCRLDATMLASARLRSAVARLRKVWPNCLQFTIVICGLPVTVPQLKLCALPTANMTEVLGALDEAATGFARRNRATAILLGDFAAEQGGVFDALLARGYARFGSPPMHILRLRHRSLAEYIAAMRSKYRYRIGLDIERFDEQRVRVEVASDAEKLDEAVAPEFYEFYLQLLGRVDFHLLTLPREFFNRLMRLYAHEIHLLRAYVDERPAGMAAGLVLGETYWFILIAVDDVLNRRYGLYPHLFLDRIEYAMSHGLKEVNLGTTADDFKLRLGTDPQPRRIYVKVRGFLRLLFGLTARFILSEGVDLRSHRVFRDAADDAPAKNPKKAQA